MTNLTLRYQVHFFHSSDSYSEGSIVFTSSVRKEAETYLKEVKFYNDSHDLTMYVEMNGKRLNEIGYYSEMGKWGFRYWIEEYTAIEPYFLADSAIDSELEYLIDSGYNWNAEKSDYTDRFKALTEEANSRFQAKEASRKAEESKALGLTVEELDRLVALRTSVNIWEPNQYVASHIPASVRTWKAEIQRLEELGISRLEEAEMKRLEESEEAESLAADTFRCDVDRYSKFSKVSSPISIANFKLAAEMLSAILQAENDCQPETNLASFQADLEEILEGNIWIDANGIVWRFRHLEGYFFPSCTIEGSSVSVETLEYLQNIVQFEADQLGSGIGYAEERISTLYLYRRNNLKDGFESLAVDHLVSIKSYQEAIRLFQNYVSRYQPISD